MAEDQVNRFPRLRKAISRHYRSGLKTLFYLFLIIGALWTIFRTAGFTPPFNDSRLKINLDPLSLPASDSPQPFIVKVSGSTTLPSRVKVIANGIPYGETWTGDNNRFDFEKVILRSTGITIEVQADALETWDSFLGFQLRTKSHARETINKAWPAASPTPAQTPAPTSNQTQPVPTPTPTPSEPAITRRKVTARISYRRMRLNLEVTLPNNDPRVVEFVSNRLTLPQFVERSLNMFMIAGRQIQDKFRGASYKTEKTAVNTTVKAESNPKYDSFQLSLNDGITIKPDWHPVENAEDSFTLDVKDYALENLNPPPTSWTNEGATWIAKRNDIDAKEGIQVKVKHSMLDDPALFFNWLKLSPYEIFWLWSYSYVAIILSLLIAFPVIWTLTLLRRAAKEAKDKQPATADSTQSFPSLQRFCRWLIALPLIAPVMYAIISLVDFLLIHEKLGNYGQALGYPALKGLQKDDLRVLMASAIILCLLASLLWLLSLAVRHRAFYWPQIIFRGIHDAAAICLSIMILLAATLSVLPSNLVGLHQFLAAAVILLLVLLTLVQVWRLRRAHPQEMRLHPNLSIIALIALILLIAAAFLAYPYHPKLPDSSITKIYNRVIEDLQIFLSLIRDMTPYLLLPVMVILLRQPKRTEPLDDFKLGQILFAGYLVGSAPNILLIPVPFIFAYWAYKRFVIEPPEQRARTDEVKGIVFQDKQRQELLERVLQVPTIKYYQDFLTEQDKKAVDDATKLSIYDRAKQQVKKHIADQQVKLKQDDETSPEAKDYLLSVGINRDNWENGKWAFWRGFILALPFLLFYIWELAQRHVGPPQSYLLMRLAGPLLAFTAYWLVSAFFFGYFFAYLRGVTGLKKGAYVSAVIAGCLFISWLASLHSPLAILLRAAQTFLFFTLLGAWADYTIISQALREKFNWAKFVQFEEVSSLTTLASAVLASLGVAITSMMTSSFTTIITQLVTMSSHQLPILPPS